MNTANKLTILRIIMVPFFMIFFMLALAPETNGAGVVTAALLLFAAASITDTLDGYIARHYNMITNFGKLMDPLADKMLTTAAFLGLMSYGRASAWAVLLILTREFIVAGIRQVSAGSGRVIAASIWGKLKTVFQMVAIIASIILLYPFCPEPTGILITNILVWLSAAVTVISGADYVIKNIDVFKEAK